MEKSRAKIVMPTWHHKPVMLPTTLLVKWNTKQRKNFWISNFERNKKGQQQSSFHYLHLDRQAWFKKMLYEENQINKLKIKLELYISLVDAEKDIHMNSDNRFVFISHKFTLNDSIV